MRFEDENSRLKRLVTDQAVQIQILKEVNAKKVVSPSQKRRAVQAIVEEHVGTTSEACRALGLVRSKPLSEQSTERGKPGDAEGDQSV